MARRARKSKSNGGISSAAGAETFPDAHSAFAPLDTSWVDQIDEIQPASLIYGQPSTGRIVDIVEPDLASDPPPEPKPEATLSVRQVTDPDVDRLWDWVRMDEDRGLAFLGFQPKTAREVYGHFALRFTDNPAAAAFAIDEQDLHIGFVLFEHIHPETMRALLHLYLSPLAQGRLLELAPVLLRMCDARYPKLSLIVVTPDEARMRLYRRTGFKVSYVLERSANGGV